MPHGHSPNNHDEIFLCPWLYFSFGLMVMFVGKKGGEHGLLYFHCRFPAFALFFWPFPFALRAWRQLPAPSLPYFLCLCSGSVHDYLPPHYPIVPLPAASCFPDESLGTIAIGLPEKIIDIPEVNRWRHLGSHTAFFFSL